MEFFNKYTPREQFDKFGIVSVHLYPFNLDCVDYIYKDKNRDIDNLYQNLEEYVHSTVYQNCRYFFKDLESLKEFCTKVEKGIL